MPQEAHTCVVTGASRGIGRAVAELLMDRGFTVTGVARQRPPDWPADFVEADLSNPAGVSAVVDRMNKLGPLWALVNVAGRGSVQRLEELSAEVMSELYWLNAVVPAMLSQAACKYMTGPGRILNISSVMALGAAGRSSYGASKAALSSLTRTWALELAPQQITVNAIAPGPIEGGMFRTLNPVGSPGEAAFLRNIPVGHVGTVDEVVDLAGYILDPTHSYLTGQVIYLDGGWSTGRAQ